MIDGAASSRPRVTACVPAWNAAAFVGPVLAALAAQTYPNLDIDISVDACDDATGEVCDAFAAGRAHVRVAHQKTRLGWIGNANRLLRDARGEYVFFAFHDDPIEPDYVARLVDALERAPAAVLAFSDVRSNLGAFRYTELEGVATRFERARRVLLQRGEWWVPNRGLMRASAVAALGGMRTTLAGEFAADHPWLLRLALLGDFVRVPLPLVTKTFRPGGVSARWRKGPLRRLGVAASCIGIVCGAGFTRRRTLLLCAEAATLALRTELWFVRQRLRRAAVSAP